VNFKVIIPARYDSTRLPGKVLLPLAGKPLIEWVYQQAKKSESSEIIIATDSEKVNSVATGFGAQVCMTASSHTTGTDRLVEVVTKKGWQDDIVVINVQGDEPLIEPELINNLATSLYTNKDASIATLATPIKTGKDQFDPNIVKVVRDKQGFALYFSRAAIPWNRDGFTQVVDTNNRETNNQKVSNVYRHIGIYAYRVGFLKKYSSMEKCELEELEALEQLRALYNGYKIVVDIVDEPPGHGVDTEDDLKKVEKILLNR